MPSLRVSVLSCPLFNVSKSTIVSYVLPSLLVVCSKRANMDLITPLWLEAKHKTQFYHTAAPLLSSLCPAGSRIQTPSPGGRCLLTLAISPSSKAPHPLHPSHCRSSPSAKYQNLAHPTFLQPQFTLPSVLHFFAPTHPTAFCPFFNARDSRS